MAALETGVMKFEGDHVKQPRVELHPGPFKSFRGRIYSATISPESAEIMAKLGTGVLIVPQKPWHLVQEETATYRETYRAAMGEEPPPPIVAGWTFVDENADRAEEQARKWIGSYWDSVIAHYEFDKPYLKSMPGYEFHSQMYDRLTAPNEKPIVARLAADPRRSARSSTAARAMAFAASSSAARTSFSASAMVAHLNLVMPSASCSSIISRILWVLICGRSRSAPPALAAIRLRFSSTRSR